jgi:hypothetical protein
MFRPFLFSVIVLPDVFVRTTHHGAEGALAGTVKLKTAVMFRV